MREPAPRFASALTKSPPGRETRSAEQDQAAGGRERRLVSLPSGKVATASITLTRLGGSTALYAYLRVRIGGRDISRYVGAVSADVRDEALAHAWQIVHRQGLLDASHLIT
jgi:DNA mismatch endonuclease (patch repair protein)